MEKLIIPTAEPFLFPGGSTGCVLVHGFTGSPKEMRLMGEFLSENGITTVGIRLAGHATQISDMVRTRWRDWLASVEDGINLLARSCDKIFLAGLSMGGALSLMASSIYEVDGVIAMSTPYKIENDWRIRFAKPISFFFPVVKKDQSDMADPDSNKNHIDYPSYPTRSIAELNDLLNHLHTQLQFIKTPVLLVNSKNDLSVPISHSDNFQRSLASNILETITLEKSGHVITEDLERNIVFRAALNFIQKNSNEPIRLNI